MPERRFQDIWKEQCQAARGVRQRHGVVSALDYLIGEKLMDYAEMAVTRPEFARELPSFVAEIRRSSAPRRSGPTSSILIECVALEDEACRRSLLAMTCPSRRRKSAQRRQNDFAG